MNMKLEVVIIPVADVDRAKAFYEKLGWRLDGDFDGGEKLRVVQVTPPRSEASIIFGKGITSAKPGSANGLVLAVDNIDAGRAELIKCGAKVSDVFHYAGLPFNNSVEKPRISGRDPDGRSYFTFASFEDPDGNRWLVQEISTRFPNREWSKSGTVRDVAAIAERLHETSEQHDRYEKTHAEHHWWDWYAAYFTARQNGQNSKDANAAADRYMDEVHHIPAR